MSKVVAIMSMSLDGYVADLNDGVAEAYSTMLAVLTAPIDLTSPVRMVPRSEPEKSLERPAERSLRFVIETTPCHLADRCILLSQPRQRDVHQRLKGAGWMM